MAVSSELDVVAVPAENEAASSYVDWPAIIGGIVLASAISVLLLAFGSAVGLTFVDFDARDGASPIFIAIAAATWLLWVQISSFMAGGYLTGRLRKRHGDATEEESDVRDGAHGLLVWGGAVIVGAVLAASGIGATANAVGSAAATITNAASNVADEAASAVDPNAYFVDLLFRPAGGTDTETAAPAAAATEPAATTPGTTTEGATTTTTTTSATTPAATPVRATPAATAPAGTDDREAVRAETGRIFARAATGELPDADRAYLVQLVADRTGLSEEEAETRVSEVTSAMDAAREEAAEAAETARKTGILGAFLFAASLLVSAIGAYWAAQKGGNHRDKGLAFVDVFRRF